MPKNSKKSVSKVILAWLLLSPLYAFAGLSPGDRAPEFELPDLDGNAVSLSDILLKNKLAVLSFFGTWCDSCLKEINDLPEIVKKYNAIVYLVGVDAEKGKLERFAAKHKIPFGTLGSYKQWARIRFMRGPSWCA